MSTEIDFEYANLKEKNTFKKIPNIPNKTNKKIDDINDREEEKVEKVNNVRNKRKIDNIPSNSKLESFSIGSKGNKTNDNNGERILKINGNFSFSKIKTNNPNESKLIINKPRTASALNLKINDNKKNGNCENTKSKSNLLSETKYENKNLKTENKKKNNGNEKILKKEKTILSLKKSYLNNKSSTSLIKNKNENISKNKKILHRDVSNNKIINNKINNKTLYNRKDSTASTNNLNISHNRINIDTSLNNTNYHKDDKRSKKFSSIYDRSKNFEEKIINKIKNLKVKLENEELKEVRNGPCINKTSKYYEKNSENFLKRVEIYKFVSEAKRLELLDKDQIRLEEELNKNPKLRKKMKLDEIQKIIDEKLKVEKIKKIEKEQIIEQKKKNLEETKLAQCTFLPEISDKSRKIDISKRSKYELHKSSSAPKFIDTDHSKKYKQMDLNENISINTLTYKHSKDILCKNNNNNNDLYSDRKPKKNLPEINLNTTINDNKIINNINNTTRNNLKDKYQDQNLRESYSMSKLTSLNDENKLISISNDNDTVSRDDNKINMSTIHLSNCSFFGNHELNISKKESDIMRELLRKKLKI